MLSAGWHAWGKVQQNLGYALVKDVAPAQVNRVPQDSHGILLERAMHAGAGHGLATGLLEVSHPDPGADPGTGRPGRALIPASPTVHHGVLGTMPQAPSGRVRWR